MKVLFVNHGRFDGASGGHIAHFARALHAHGHAVGVAAEGPVEAVREWGRAPFAVLPRDRLQIQPAAALAFDGHAGTAGDTVVIAWTPRESVRTAVQALRRRQDFHTVIHLEDDERVLTAAHLGRPWNDLSCLPPHELDPLITPGLTHPHRMGAFLAAADGVTAVAAPLLAYAPAAPAHLLRPGCDPNGPPSPLKPEQRRALLSRLGVPAHHRIIVHPGDVHPANRREVFSLYVAVQILRRRGLELTLVRTGETSPSGEDAALGDLRGRVSRELGRLSRRELSVLLRLGDLFVQPGAPDAFNLSRLPPKLPQLFLTGRPVLLPRANLGLEVRDGEEACVLERGDGVEIADRAEPLLRDEPRAAAMGAAGRRFVLRTLDWERSAQGLERFLTTLAARPRRPSGMAA